ncbi:hypothetical protein [Myxococcus sp. CA039A]|uniref:hypothetical protein n=1 Tax=Myxococcus sp. CA039A TaxID=2741737 RepID=UPI00157A2CAF|nr:hypothetical protein [Myxococcus sp. CA039A]NTX51132.1 hypothetical protein [Myxococcus sp. CA039A]
MTIKPDRLRLALQELGADAGFEFEVFANRFLASDFPDLRPVGGIHDGGRDAFLHQSTELPDVFVQHSVTQDWIKKINSTVKTLQENGHTVRELIYCTNQEIQKRTDDLKKTLRQKKITLDIRDQGYFTTFCNTNTDRSAASEDLARKFVDPLLRSKGVPSSSSTELTSEEERVALVYLQLEIQTKDPSKALTKFSYDTLIIHTLRDSTPEAPIPRAKLYDSLIRLMHRADHARVRIMIDNALKRLTERGVIKHHMKDSAYTLSHTQRTEIKSRIEQMLVQKNIVEHEVSERAKELKETLELDYDFDPQQIARDALTVTDHLIATQGRLSALTFIGRPGVYYSRPESAAQAAKHISEKSPSVLLSLPSLGVDKFLDLIPPLVDSIIRNPTPAISHRLNEAADAYCLLFSLRETGETQNALEKLFHGVKLWIDTNILVPCLAEQLLPEEQRRMTNLLTLTARSGIELLIGDDVLNELETHLERLRYAFPRRFANPANTLSVAQSAYAQPLLVSSFLAATKPARFTSFDEFIDTFMGQGNPKQDLIDFLKHELSIEYKPLDQDMTDAASQPEVGTLFAQWSEQKKQKPWMDDQAFARLVLHDTRSYLLVEKLRASDKSSDVKYGYLWWWLTLDGVAYRVDAERRKHRGVPICIGPDFFLRYLSVRPKSADEHRRIRDLLPVSVEMAALGYIPSELRAEAEKLFETTQNLPEYLRRRKLRDLANQAIAGRGDFEARNSPDTKRAKK